MMGKILINGKFLGRSPTGVDRFAVDMIRQLDGFCSGRDVELLIPPGTDTGVPKLANIRVRAIGCLRGLLWEQISLPLYAVRTKGMRE